MPSPSRWIGSVSCRYLAGSTLCFKRLHNPCACIHWAQESGYAPYPTWSTCDYSGSGAGDPDSPDWYPAETDFTVLDGDT